MGGVADMLAEVADRAARRGEPARAVAALRTPTATPPAVPLRDDTVAELRTVAVAAAGLPVGRFAAAATDAGERAAQLLRREVEEAAVGVDDEERKAWTAGPLLAAWRLRGTEEVWLARRDIVEAAFEVARRVAQAGATHHFVGDPEAGGRLPMPPMPLGPRGVGVAVAAGRQLDAWRGCKGLMAVDELTFTVQPLWLRPLVLLDSPADTAQRWRRTWDRLLAAPSEPVCIALSSSRTIWPDEVDGLRAALEQTMPELFAHASRPQVAFDGDGDTVLVYGMPAAQAQSVYERGPTVLSLPASDGQGPPLRVIAQPV